MDCGKSVVRGFVIMSHMPGAGTWAAALILD